MQKYGGTSVGTASRMDSVAAIVKHSATTDRVIVVLSAMSSYIKKEGTTSLLLEAVDDILLPNSTLYLDIVDKIEANHLSTVTEALSDQSLRAESVAFIRHECQRLRSFMSAAEIIEEISPKSRDVIISTGEKLSAQIFSMVLRDRGVKSAFVNLEKIVQQHFDAKNLDQRFYDYLSQRLAEVINSLDANCVPVVTGFLGPVPGSLVSSIGRGYTDLTAALVAVGTGAKELQIWKEVDGIFTADPRKVESAKLLPIISPEEAAELTYYGSEVIHPFTMEQVIRACIPIRIKNAFNPEGNGTLIVPNSEADGSEFGQPYNIVSTGPKHATAVTIKDNITVVNVHSNRKSVSHGFLAQIFSILDRFGVTVDLISTSEVHVSMAISSNNTTDGKLKSALEELAHYGSLQTLSNMAIVSIVGRQMRNAVGMASTMFNVLARNDVNIEMISQGASEINISCVVEERLAVLALRAIHDACVLGCL